MDFLERDVQFLFTGNKALIHCRTSLLIFKPNEGLCLECAGRGRASRCAVCLSGAPPPAGFLLPFLFLFLSLLSPSISRTLSSGGGCSWKHPALQQNTSTPSPGLHHWLKICRDVWLMVWPDFKKPNSRPLEGLSLYECTLEPQWKSQPLAVWQLARCYG